MTGNCLSVTAPAKVNLYLHVTGKRPDGYHLLDSLVVFTRFGDEITVQPAQDLTLEVSGPFATGIPTDSSNLVLKAAVALRDWAGGDLGAQITLDKRIPVAAGVGGGSADAAAVLRALVQLWDLVITEQDLLELALSLGADVPVCLAGKPTYMAGIGEDLSPAPELPSFGVLLANPMRHLSTPEVFKARSADFSMSGNLIPDEFSDRTRFIKALSRHQNDLQQPAEKLVPAISHLLETLENTKGALFTAMSGSGATCFSLYSDPVEAEKAAVTLITSHPDWWFQPSEILKEQG